MIFNEYLINCETKLINKTYFCIYFRYLYLSVDENDVDETSLVSKIFEFNEIEIGCHENVESDSEYDFESDNSDNEKELENNDDENDVIIEQKLSNNLTPCVLIDKIDGKIQRCKNTESVTINRDMANR
ncbi:hypothetical protein Glove_155g62 [Diversispora epigaea]|uniref:Uncharacterized protein n=1 Tax=Diversispora epigaea TaxID=1348612 RepID=A0A397ISB6_9GLOM|nr:hypothetical protein Glove_155g62 [Diversispora epigaea]